MRLLLAAFVCLSLIACGGTRQVAHLPNTAVPVKDSLARIFIGRDPATQPPAIARQSYGSIKVFVDGAYVGRMDLSGLLVIDHLPGALTIVVDGGTTGDKSLEVTAPAGRNTCIAIGQEPTTETFVKVLDADRSAQWLKAYGTGKSVNGVYKDPSEVQEEKADKAKKTTGK